MRRIGGSMVASILGCNPYQTKHSAWLYLTDQIDGPEDNAAMKRGRVMEEPVAQTFQSFHDEFEVKKTKYSFENQYIDPVYDFLCSLPDREISYAGESEPVGLLEIKTATIHSKQQWGEEGTADIPLNYYCQGQWYMGMFGLPVCYYPVMFFNDSIRKTTYSEYVVEYDREFYEMAREACVKFWTDCVDGKQEPALDELDAGTEQWIKKSFPCNTSPEEPATPEEESVIDQYVEALRTLKDAETKTEKLKAAIQLLIGNRDGIISLKGKFTWKNNKQSVKTDFKKLVEELDVSKELIAAYTTITPGPRVFRTPKFNF